jgi:NADPH-dependent glutamate synthase beta subunit-like oxidoreductase
MYQKDYILRMLEMLSDLIALILGLIKKGDIRQASERLERDNKINAIKERINRLKVNF